MNGNIDKVREALNELQGLIHHIERTTGHEYDSRKLHAALAALSTIDPEAIRRECAEKAIAYMRDLWDGWTMDELRAAILSAEPAKDDGEPDAFASAIVKELRVNWTFDTEDALSVLNGAKRRL